MVHNLREARLHGVGEAAKLHKEFGLREVIHKNGGCIDVFDAIRQRDYGLLFQPLDGLLGLCVQDPAPGILVTTQLPLSVQRFTAAHELGHLEMGHEFSFDNDENIWRPRGVSRADLQEVSANSFGAEFLMPKWLLKNKMEKRGWTVVQLENPLNVYQLSLRLGVSYLAVCWTLLRHEWITNDACRQLRSVEPKKIKLDLLKQSSLPDKSTNVWDLSLEDHEEIIDAGPHDIFLINLNEHGTGGYRWNVKDAISQGFNINLRPPLYSTDEVGGAMEQCWELTTSGPIHADLDLVERRPWQPADVLACLSLEISTLGKEFGLPRYERISRLAA